MALGSGSLQPLAAVMVGVVGVVEIAGMVAAAPALAPAAAAVIIVEALPGLRLPAIAVAFPPGLVAGGLLVAPDAAGVAAVPAALCPDVSVPPLVLLSLLPLLDEPQAQSVATSAIRIDLIIRHLFERSHIHASCRAHIGGYYVREGSDWL
jgi:hypothetical protein